MANKLLDYYKSEYGEEVDPIIKNTLENDVNQLKEKTVVNSTEQN